MEQAIAAAAQPAPRSRRHCGRYELHTSSDAGGVNSPPEHIANVDDSGAHWIKLVAREDGSFRVLNGRTRHWQKYQARGQLRKGS